MEVSTIFKTLEQLKHRKQDLLDEIQNLLQKEVEQLRRASAPNAYSPQRVALDSKEIDRIGNEMERQSRTLQLRQMELTRITMNRKALEALKEKRRIEAAQKKNRRQQKELDENFRLLGNIK
ncbi:MAG: hypothetical protein HY537_10600 [Deltaproteobacteria bacterium]|nr:hypothetical protein [Deltaproteobacteria bacterium]